nr:HAMP domain-containing sensor histidine kinase [Sphingomonas sp. ID1715]
MGGEDWAQLIPDLSPVARALLRHRRDLPKKARRALDLFAAGDLVLDGPASLDLPRSEAAAPPLEPAVVPAQPEFAFETGADGLIRWCDLVDRGAAIGISIAEPAAPGAAGVDGQAAGAFRRRSPFRDARLLLPAPGSAGGGWTISGVPSFDPPTGRFTGYRGVARRPRVGERAEPLGLLGSTLTSDSLRQLAHEVRTPLNAIAGFAEMIDQQMLGPAAAPYRARAASILAEARRIEQVLDDLEEAGRIAGDAPPAAPEPVDCGQLIARIAGTLAPLAAERGVVVALAIAPRCESALLNPVAAERMTSRLLSAAIALGGEGERVEISAAPADGSLPETWIAVSRPACTQGHDEQRLLDALQPDEDETLAAASPLGLGFTLRLVRSVAESCGGQLAFTPDCFRLRLPTVSAGHGHSNVEARSPLATVNAAPLSPAGAVGPVAQR